MLPRRHRLNKMGNQNPLRIFGTAPMTPPLGQYGDSGQHKAGVLEITLRNLLLQKMLRHDKTVVNGPDLLPLGERPTYPCCDRFQSARRDR